MKICKRLLRKRSVISAYHDRCADNIEKYKVANKTAKRAVSEAKGRAYEDLYQRLSAKEGDKEHLPTFECEGKREGHL